MSQFRTNRVTASSEFSGGAAGQAVTAIDVEAGTGEQEILREIAAALKSIRYGSIVLTIHEGRLVEFSKTVRSRMGSK
jgi:hypothetical protein